MCIQIRELRARVDQLERERNEAPTGANHRGRTGAARRCPQSHGNAMEMLAIEDGLRLTDVAARAGMAPQSMGELIDDLVSKGYLKRREDPEDRRAKRIYLTTKGRATAETSRVSVANLERQLSARLGAVQYRQMRRHLAGVIEQFG